MCDCTIIFRTDYNTDVCTACGREVPVGLSIIQVRSPMDMSPFPHGYSKEKRFLKLLDGVLYPTPSAADNAMLEFLDGKKFASVAVLLAGMRKAGIRDKRYVSLHLFARLFVTTYTPPPPPNRELRRRLLREFEEVEFGHRRFCRGRPFFNYAWLLRRFLHEFCLFDHTRFVKQLRCRHRKRAYRQMLAIIRHAYSAAAAEGGASNSQRRLSGLWGGPRLRPAPIPTSAKSRETHPLRCVADRTCAKPASSGQSCPLRRVFVPVVEEALRALQRPKEPACSREVVCRGQAFERLSGWLLQVSGPSRIYRPPPSESPSDSPP